MAKLGWRGENARQRNRNRKGKINRRGKIEK